MKIDSVIANNRKKAFEVRVADATYALPYAVLNLQPDAKNRVTEAVPDAELGMEGFTYRLADGSEDTIHLDAVLEYNQDPDHLKGLMLYRLTLEALKAVEASDLSKRELIRRLDTSASQFYRLLDPANSTKSLGQMLALLHLLGKDVDIVISQQSAREPAVKRRRRGLAECP